MNEIVPPGALDRLRLSDTVYAVLFDHIADGKYSIGGRLPPENQLAQHFAVSRPVVREALRRLQSDGIIVSRQGSGTYVRRSPARQSVTPTINQRLHDLLQGFEVRLSLEELAARLAARNRKALDLVEMERAAQALRLAFANNVSREVKINADRAFHRAIAAASGNPLLVGVLDALTERLKADLHATLPPGDEVSAQCCACVLDEHDHVLNAIRGGDPDSAAIAMRYHVDRARHRAIDRQIEH